MRDEEEKARRIKNRRERRECRRLKNKKGKRKEGTEKVKKKEKEGTKGEVVAGSRERSEKYRSTVPRPSFHAPNLSRRLAARLIIMVVLASTVNSRPRIFNWSIIPDLFNGRKFNDVPPSCKSSLFYSNP